MSLQARDLACVIRMRDGDTRALEELYDRYTSSLLYPVALRILGRPPEAEEAVQDAWVQAWRGAENYDPRRGTVAAWLLTFARSRALDRLRATASKGRFESDQEVGEDVDPAVSESATASVETLERHRRVKAALETLEPHHRQVLEIAFFEGLSQSRIAERLQAPLGTVKSWTRQGMHRLRVLLGAEEAS